MNARGEPETLDRRQESNQRARVPTDLLMLSDVADKRIEREPPKMEDRGGPPVLIYFPSIRRPLFIVYLEDATRANSTGCGDPFSVASGMRNDGGEDREK